MVTDRPGVGRPCPNASTPTGHWVSVCPRPHTDGGGLLVEGHDWEVQRADTAVWMLDVSLKGCPVPMGLMCEHLRTEGLAVGANAGSG